MYTSLVIAVVFPIFCTVFLFKNKEKLLEENFKAKYGTLYTNLKTLMKST